MEAIEFVANIQENIIKIPKKYAGSLGKKVHIIILVDKEPASSKKLSSKASSEQSKKKSKKFSAFSIKTKGLKIHSN